MGRRLLVIPLLIVTAALAVTPAVASESDPESSLTVGATENPSPAASSSAPEEGPEPTEDTTALAPAPGEVTVTKKSPEPEVTADTTETEQAEGVFSADISWPDPSARSIVVTGTGVPTARVEASGSGQTSETIVAADGTYSLVLSGLSWGTFEVYVAHSFEGVEDGIVFEIQFTYPELLPVTASYTVVDQVNGVVRIYGTATPGLTVNVEQKIAGGSLELVGQDFVRDDGTWSIGNVDISRGREFHIIQLDDSLQYANDASLLVTLSTDDEATSTAVPVVSDASPGVADTRLAHTGAQSIVPVGIASGLLILLSASLLIGRRYLAARR